MIPEEEANITCTKTYPLGRVNMRIVEKNKRNNKWTRQNSCRARTILEEQIGKWTRRQKQLAETTKGGSAQSVGQPNTPTIPREECQQRTIVAQPEEAEDITKNPVEEWCGGEATKTNMVVTPGKSPVTLISQREQATRGRHFMQNKIPSTGKMHYAKNVLNPGKRAQSAGKRERDNGACSVRLCQGQYPRSLKQYPRSLKLRKRRIQVKPKENHWVQAGEWTRRGNPLSFNK